MVPHSAVTNKNESLEVLPVKVSAFIETTLSVENLINWTAILKEQ
jgi:hypothetical protein